ncbi:hypothetical protein LIER_01415 [Lithospermum erythrorhizon]|uniref:Uncharacterized protein n=1 Tax=Lithospermum erythrorhizon TaxID=34254 RepID=A0AAV3NKT4_LITER
MLSASFLKQHMEVVMPDHVEDNHEDDIDGQNMEKSSSDKSGTRKKQPVLTRFEKSVIDGDVEPGTPGQKRRYKWPYARHGVQFKERRESGWVEGEESEESDGVLGDKIYYSDFDSGDSTSDSDGDCNVLRLIDDASKKRSSSQFKEVMTWYATTTRKDVRFICNEKHMLGARCIYPCDGVCGCQKTRN